MFCQWKTHFFPLWTDFFYTLGYASLIPKVQILDLLNKILVTVLGDELDYRKMTEVPITYSWHLFLPPNLDARRTRHLWNPIFLMSWLNTFFFSRQWSILHVLDFPCYIQLWHQNVCHILYSSKKEPLYCSICSYNDHLGWNCIEESHAWYNIVEINELVILIATLALAIHAQLKNLSTGLKIETVKEHSN